MWLALLCSLRSRRSHDGASPIALLRASLFFPASANNRAKDFALRAVAVRLQEFDVAVDEDGLAFLESVGDQLANWPRTTDHSRM
jgi:hypothetical protein